ncbi:MAG TPA: hypothetical protein VEL76_38510 [Gemmataceae bacterium]|nr:hypothetical protein [Gemmataceae bacterium]
MSGLRHSVTISLLPILLFVVAPAVFAQGSDDERRDPLGELSRKAARDLFEVTQANRQELARAKLETARQGYAASLEQYLMGERISDHVIEWSLRLLEAERAAGDPGEAPSAPFERHWLRTLEVEVPARSKYESGKVSASEYLEPRYARLSAALAWAQARARQPAAKGRTTVSVPLLEGDGFDPSEQARRLAKAKFDAVQESPKTLARARAETAAAAVNARFQEFVAGNRTVDFFLAASVRRLEAELAHEGGADPAAVAEALWEVTREAYRINRAGYDSGRIPITDSAQATYAHLAAARRWVLARAGQGKPSPARMVWLLELEGDALPPDHVAQEIRELARDKFEAMAADPADLARRALDAARAHFEARLQEWGAGKTPVIFVLESLPRVIEAERSVRGDKADLSELLAEQWAWAREVEVGEQGKYDAGKIPVTSYLLALYYRLDAELAWLQAIKKAK